MGLPQLCCYGSLQPPAPSRPPIKQAVVRQAAAREEGCASLDVHKRVAAGNRIVQAEAGSCRHSRRVSALLTSPVNLEGYSEQARLQFGLAT